MTAPSLPPGRDSTVTVREVSQLAVVKVRDDGETVTYWFDEATPTVTAAVGLTASVRV